MAHDLHSLRRVANQARVIPGSMGLRRYRVYVEVRESSGSYPGEGSVVTSYEEVLEAGYPPKVKEATGEEIALNGLDSGTHNVGPITPYYNDGGQTGGTRYETLKPDVQSQGGSVVYRISGEEFGDCGKLFALTSIDHDRNFRYMLKLSPIEDAS